ncbi:MAG: riboflavin biosynthesis protein RibF [Oscillospiraceae bacterium]|jgi:riboflavin kinase/FMN adenylyltransferase|nr:riboflavin biosynthesis protein RibF [Oscillospiraceae bacterium]
MAQSGRFIALGAFDGLHRAHIAVLEAAAAGGAARGLRPAVLLFAQHPLRWIAGEAPPLLLRDAERDARLEAMGLEILKRPFEPLRTLPPEVFFERILCGQLGAQGLSCGYHYRFGLDAAGDAPLLQRLCAARGVQLAVIPKMEYDGAPISSTRIRQALAEGNIEAANAMLGRPFGYDYPVEEGDRIGRTLGAPTINQHFPPGVAVPRYGVYAAQAFVDGRWLPGVTNIGRRPSFASSALRSETHILGFAGDLYGQRIPVALLSFLRPERSFSTLNALAQQIAIDKEHARKAE